MRKKLVVAFVVLCALIVVIGAAYHMGSIADTEPPTLLDIAVDQARQSSQEIFVVEGVIVHDNEDDRFITDQIAILMHEPSATTIVVADVDNSVAGDGWVPSRRIVESWRFADLSSVYLVQHSGTWRTVINETGVIEDFQPNFSPVNSRQADIIKNGSPRFLDVIVEEVGEL